MFFSETRDPDLSNGLGPISVYALLKKLSGVQGRPHEHPLSENQKISNSGQIWGSDGRVFRQFPVLTHNFQIKVTRRAPSCKTSMELKSNTGWPAS